MAKFTPFPVPVRTDYVGEDGVLIPGDTPLVTHAGKMYRCSGCGALIPEGFWVTEAIEDGMIVGLSMRIGADGPFVHGCGKLSDD